jgi:(p)ppGpp synthase/HD superfamily hydrolase
VGDPNFVPSDKVANAVGFAASSHGRQTRKATSIPYLQHLLGVASIAMEHGADETVTIAALLHDVIEDTDVTEADLKEHFGPEVAEIVRWCSAEAKTAGDDPAGSWQARKRAYICHLAEAPPAAVLVSLADKIHNARSVAADYRRAGRRDEYWDRFNAGKQDQLWYFEMLIDMYEERAAEADARITDAMVEELRRAVAEIAR